MTRSRMQHRALRALIAALLLWAAPARPVSAAPLTEVPVLIAVRGATTPRATVEVARPPTYSSPSGPQATVRAAVVAPPSPTFGSASPRYLLHCALLR